MIKISEIVNLHKPFILASKSPRRRRLLTQLGFEFTVEPSSVKEKENSIEDPEDHVRQLALMKARDIAARHDEEALILGSDTTVYLDGSMLHKPADEADAVRTLRTLSGRTHVVYSGVALVESPSGRSAAGVQATKVTFRELADDEIKAYVATGSPMDKAGAYGIQDDFGAVFVEHIEGCYYNIVGLPLKLMYTMMRDFLK